MPGALEMYTGGTDEEVGDDELQLAVPWAIYGVAASGDRSLAQIFREEHTSPLPTELRNVLDAQLSAWLTVWDVRRVERGVGVEVTDLLSGEERFVHEISGSTTLSARDVLLTTDHFDVLVPDRSTLLARVCTIAGAGEPDIGDSDRDETTIMVTKPGNATMKSWDNAIIGRIVIEGNRMRVVPRCKAHATRQRARPIARGGPALACSESTDPCAPGPGRHSLAISLAVFVKGRNPYPYMSASKVSLLQLS